APCRRRPTGAVGTGSADPITCCALTDGTDAPLPARKLGPATAGPIRNRQCPQDQAGAGTVSCGQALAPRAEMRRPGADHDPSNGPAAAQARLARPLVDGQVILHLAVAVGRG